MGDQPIVVPPLTEDELYSLLRYAWNLGMQHGIGNNGASYPCPDPEEALAHLRASRDRYDHGV